MAIFDDVVVNAKTAASVVSKKAGELYDLSKLRISLATLRSELNKRYQALGEAVYNDEADEEIEVIKAEIADVKQNIADVEKILIASRNTIKCSHCGQKLNKNASYCFACGAPVPQEPNPVCPSCGAELVKEAEFCFKCGTPVASKEAEDKTEENTAD